MRRLFPAAVISLILAVACEEEYFPPGLYGYQVERLLTADTFKTWQVTEWVADGSSISLDECHDLFRLVFEKVENDSITCFQLQSTSECQFTDSTFYGSVFASSFENIFTDSLVFEGGEMDYMILEAITSEEFSVHFTESRIRNDMSFKVIK